MPTPATRVAQLSKLDANHATRVIVDGKKILLVRDGDAVHAYAAECPHAGGPLEEGALCNGKIICPWHKGAFDMSTGEVLEPPALVALDRYPVTVTGDDVMVSPEKLPEPVRSAVEKHAHHVVLGAGAAGAAACAALRQSGFSGRITLVGEEAYVPYDRTSLSKFVLSGEMAAADVPTLLAPDWLAQHAVERIVAKVVSLDVSKRTIRFDNDDGLIYDAALLATGSVPKVPPISGHDLAGVYVLRNRDHAAALVDAIDKTSKVAILGSSFIGLEAASSLRKRGAQVTVISPDTVPFAKQFGERVGTMFRELHEHNGVAFRLGEKVKSLEGDAGHVKTAVLESGDHVEADVVLVGTGVTPATGFVEGLTLHKDGGVIVDAGMQAAPGLYAAGDVAVFPLHAGQAPLRIEHWRVAQQHARIAAQNMCGASSHYASVPYFWTYHFGKQFEYLGHANEWDDVVIDGKLDEQQFAAFYVKGDNVVAVLACDRDMQTAHLIEAMTGILSLADALKIINHA